MTIKLKERTGWKNGDGRTVYIAGRTKTKEFWWSLQGDWYDDEGRKVHWVRTATSVETHHYVLKGHPDNLVEEFNATHFWEGVVLP